MGLADGEVLVDDRLIYTANDLKVGLFPGYFRFLITFSSGLKAKPRYAEASFKETVSGR